MVVTTESTVAIRSDVASARTRAERTLAVVVAISRGGSLVVLAGSLAGAHSEGRAVPLAVLTAIAVVGTVGLITSCVVSGQVSVRWAGFDVICVITAIVLSDLPVILPGTPDLSPFYNFSVVAAICFGLPRWSLTTTLMIATVLVVANISCALRAGSAYPLWNAVPDSATYVGAGVLSWGLARLLRRSAQSLDRHHEAAVERAAGLARERERARQQQELGTHLLSTVDDLAVSDVVTDPHVRDQIRREADWLHRVVESGLPEPDSGLIHALRDLVAEKMVAGMNIELELPDREPAIPHAAASAVAGAVREALTNVAKHSGTTRASVSVRHGVGGVEVEVTDVGRGYDVAMTRSRVGQRRSIQERIEAVGGHVTFSSERDRGTRVRVWVPVVEEDQR